MISFRHHLVSIVSVFLALAVGVVLGGGPLSEVGRTQGVAASTGATTDAGADAGARSGDAFAAAVAPAVLRGRLGATGVALVTLPGADPAVVEALGSRVEQAGSQVVATYAVEEALLAPGEKALVDTLGSQLRTQYAVDAVPAQAPTYERLGRLLALAITTTVGGGEPTDARATSVLDSLAGAGLVTSEDGLDRRPPLVLVVQGDEPGATEDGATPTDAILAGLVGGLRQGSVGVVLAGDTQSGTDGQLSRLREDEALDEVATVAGVETTVGQVTTVLALAAARRGAAGDFGASGADGAVPLG